MTNDQGAFACYGAIPFRAFRDKHLAGVPLALLGVIAAHDRFGRNGQGCTANQSRLAELIGCRREAINAAVGVLDALGYITCGLDEKTGRRRSYSVRYDNKADNLAFRAGQERSGAKRPKACAPRRVPLTTTTTMCGTAHIGASAPETEKAQQEPDTAAELVPAAQAADGQTASALEHTGQDTEIRLQGADTTAECQSVPIKEYIPRSGVEKSTSEKSGLAVEQGATSNPIHLCPGDEPFSSQNRSQQAANERMWEKHGHPKLTDTAAFQGDRRQRACAGETRR